MRGARLLRLALLAPALMACTAKEVPFAPLDLGRASGMGAKGAACAYLATEAEFLRLFREIRAGELPPPEPPKVDFGTKAVLFFSPGMKPTGGWRVSIEGVQRRGDALRATVAVREPDPGMMHAQAMTRPYALATVAREEGAARLEFVSPAGEALCEREIEAK
ncbi:MAG: protease complex subunit PrcB family protein [Candidatus Methylomirabilis sp.]|nr:protease complex subunit PrcB family protein [Deltaproteobacteria bacterium]